VYGDQSGRLSQFVPSGYMGDMNDLSTVTMSSDESAPASTGRTGNTSLKVQYRAKGKQGWAGIYWLSPANNWGMIKGAGFDLRKAKKLTFWLRGEKGGERISQVKVGGVNGPYPDSDAAWLGPLSLSKDWKQYTIDLEGKDLHHIIGGFMFLIRQADNPRGATFFMDEVVFRGSPKDEVEPSVVNSEEEKKSKDSSFTEKNDDPTTAVGTTQVTKTQIPANSIAPQKTSPAVILREPKATEESRLSVTKSQRRDPSPSAQDNNPQPIPTPARWLRYKKNASHAE
jgi:hypothetical protein